MQHYGERAKEWINDHDLKQKKLAQELDVTPSVLSNYLTGRSVMPVEILVKMAQKFEVSVDYLVGLSDESVQPMVLQKSERQLIESFRTLSSQQKELILQIIHICYTQF